nr:vegetative cell wall protein gp1-like [Aegilops tauschii subsp. strangulata]
MASRVSLSGASSSSTSSGPSAQPSARAPLRSIVVGPEVLGTAFGPILQGGAAGPSRPTAVDPFAWRTRASRRPRSPASPSHPPTSRRRRGSPEVLPTSRPPKTSIPAGHIARECNRPRSSSPVDVVGRDPLAPCPPEGFPSRVLPPPGSLPFVRVLVDSGRSAPALPPPPPGPPPSEAVRLCRPWCEVVRPSAERVVAGLGFSIPFSGHAVVGALPLQAQGWRRWKGASLGPLRSSPAWRLTLRARSW